MAASYCASHHVVGRTFNGNVADLIDARSRDSNVVSNATDAEDEVDDNDVTTERSAGRPKVVALTDLKNGSRVRRDSPHHQAVRNILHITLLLRIELLSVDIHA